MSEADEIKKQIETLVDLALERRSRIDEQKYVERGEELLTRLEGFSEELLTLLGKYVARSDVLLEVVQKAREIDEQRALHLAQQNTKLRSEIIGLVTKDMKEISKQEMEQIRDTAQRLLNQIVEQTAVQINRIGYLFMGFGGLMFVVLIAGLIYRFFVGTSGR